MFANCNEVLCSPLNPSLIDATGVVTDQFIAERKLSQLQAELQQQIPVGQIGVLMQPPRHGEENQTNINLAAYPRQPQIQRNNQNATASNNFHNNPTKLNLEAEERPNGVGKNI